MKGSNLNSFGLNLYANSIGAEGAQHVANGLTQTSPKKLDVDLYFNNITEVGTKYLSDSLAKQKSLEELSLNLDFNYIKNEGAK